MSTVLKIDNAHKRFDQTQALAGAELSLQQGEWQALLGPNGAGKTTLVRTIAGRVRLDQGAVTLLGENLNGSTGSRGARSKLGIVPQEIALYPLMTAVENMRAFGTLHGLSGKDLQQRVEWALSWTGLDQRAKEPIKRFSGGMKRRLNIACGVLHQPEVILLDEPTVGVDPQSRQRIWDMLGELHRKGASLLLTTHQLDEAQQVSQRITIIDHGKMIATGTFDELLQQTIGTQRQVICQLKGESLNTLEQQGWKKGENGTFSRQVENVSDELPGLLTSIKECGAEVMNLHIEAPTLQAVFLHLTGRELRE